MLAFSSSFAASYAVSVRRASVLPAASSGFHLAMDTLAVRLTIPPAGFVEDFHLRVSAPCRAHKQKAANWRLAKWLIGLMRPARLERATFWFVARSGLLAPIDIWRQLSTFSTSCSHRPMRLYTSK